jgi:hypothetical protein
MSLTASTANIFINPMHPLLYLPGLLTGLATLFGFALIFFHVSCIHGTLFLLVSIFGLLLLIEHAGRTKRIAKEGTANQDDAGSQT